MTELERVLSLIAALSTLQVVHLWIAKRDLRRDIRRVETSLRPAARPTDLDDVMSTLHIHALNHGELRRKVEVLTDLIDALPSYTELHDLKIALQRKDK